MELETERSDHSMVLALTQGIQSPYSFRSHPNHSLRNWGGKTAVCFYPTRGRYLLGRYGSFYVAGLVCTTGGYARCHWASLGVCLGWARLAGSFRRVRQQLGEEQAVHKLDQLALGA